MRRGYLVAFEGIDGCGKTTIVRFIRDSLLSAGRLVGYILVRHSQL